MGETEIWDFPKPFVMSILVQADAIDHYGHVNNAVYVNWLQEVAWRQIAAEGISLHDYQQWQCAMVVKQHCLDYLLPAYLGDHLQLATWITRCDERWALQRTFQLVRTKDKETILRAVSTYNCVTLQGKPRRFPAGLLATYQRLTGDTC
ncbi:acyl-CoA thioesterase [Zooshikella marina]|uniref:Acyl-CoA thioesterase n=1 Tax=Zooshikella ganghwensis TaxID=202772 RepID=A0A4P9VLB9_9GAMM|nr:acyl-CoA thioesterase [Zooshikella ganghwensis]MBU2706835.1 acyl-CoA thioesterase [Zooshikella ganghwensis]RDH43586.1 acyl-CoA thioesterase [Zooshikella ganghwensis]